MESVLPFSGYTSMPSYPQKNYDFPVFQDNQGLAKNTMTSFPTLNDDISKRIAA
jgi:hypothetical protein